MTINQIKMKAALAFAVLVSLPSASSAQQVGASSTSARQLRGGDVCVQKTASGVYEVTDCSGGNGSLQIENTTIGSDGHITQNQTPSASIQNFLSSDNSTTTTMVIKGVAAQTGDLFQAVNSTSNVLMSLQPDGDMFFNQAFAGPTSYWYPDALGGSNWMKYDAAANAGYGELEFKISSANSDSSGVIVVRELDNLSGSDALITAEAWSISAGAVDQVGVLGVSHGHEQAASTVEAWTGVRGVSYIDKENTEDFTGDNALIGVIGFVGTELISLTPFTVTGASSIVADSGMVDSDITVTDLRGLHVTGDSGAGSEANITTFTGIEIDLFDDATTNLAIAVEGTSNDILQVDFNETAGETALLIGVGGAAVQRVSVDASDSCGAGFRCLRIPN